MMPSNIEHVIVLMMENRSFDNVLGGLYLPGSNPPHPAPAGWLGLDPAEPQESCEQQGQHNVCDQTEECILPWNWRNPPDARYLPTNPADQNPFVSPCPNPHEHYSYVQWELFGGSKKPPGKVPLPPPDTSPCMSGFATCYYDKLAEKGIDPQFYQYAQIMHYFSPQDLPVTSGLAYSFGVCDRWFSSVPTQTYANRLFTLIGTSNGIVDNDQWLGYCGDETTVSKQCTSEKPGEGFVYAQSIFHQLDDLPQGTLPDQRWKVYYQSHPIAAQISYVHNRYDKPNVAPWETFYSDLKNPEPDGLPAFSWLEPKYGTGGNSNHPANNVLDGEAVILEVYEALRESSYWEKSLLIVTYDEHGGLYDHISPPIGQIAPTRVLQCPDCYDVPTSNFDFTMYGIRVPTLLISPWIAPATVLKTYQGQPANFEHTSLIKTVFDTFGVTNWLDKRDQQAPTVEDVFTNPQKDGAQPNSGPDLTGVLDKKNFPPYADDTCAEALPEDDPLVAFEAAASTCLDKH